MIWVSETEFLIPVILLRTIIGEGCQTEKKIKYKAV